MLYAPSDLINFMESEYVSWMDRLYKLYPDRLTPDESDESTKILQVHGDLHERNFVSFLVAQGREVYEVPAEGDAIGNTLEAMKAGREVIYQGVLTLDQFEGRSDFLVRNNDKPSSLGNYSYEVWDTKLARKAKPYFIIQLCCYAEMLCHAQGVLPESIAVVLGDKQVERFRTADYFSFYTSLKAAFLKFHENFDEHNPPAEIELPTYSRWNSYAERALEERDDLVRVANIRKMQIKKLKTAGISTMQQLASSPADRIPKMLNSTFQALKQQAKLQIASKGLAKPLFELIPANELDARTGLALLPPASPSDVFFDMEGYPHMEGGLEYLFGATYLDSGKNPQFIDWWAHDRDQERKAFEQFIDWVYSRWKTEPEMHVYHYAAYEVSAMKRLMGRHGTREFELDELLRNDVFVDLYQIVRQGLRVGEPSYSIKNIEHLYMEKRSGQVAKATDSVVYYERWLESEREEQWQDSAILQAIRDYNKDDCDSTWLLAEWLWKLQAEFNISYIPKGPQCGSKTDEVLAESEEEDEEPKQKPLNTKEAAASLMLEMLAEVPDNTQEQPEKWRIHQLLAWLLCFHDREYKPVYWAMFDRHSMTEEELIDDMNCLGALQSDDSCAWKTSPPGKRPRSYLYEFKFDTNQDTKLAEDDDVFFAHDLSMKAKIFKLDRDAGRVIVKLGSTKPEPPRRASLIPSEFAGERTIAESILRVVLKWRLSGQLPSAIEDFLRRRFPRVTGKTQGQPLLPDDASPDEIAELVSSLKESTLSIQGPPGSGKTYTGSVVIAHLLSKGFKVGITSNSHSAVLQLMNKAIQQCEARHVAVNAVKIGGTKPADQESMGWKKSAKDLFSNCDKHVNLIGGTAYAFSNPMAASSIDFLFVDEAGQVSVANLVGMSPSTKNIVLLGDQMQLDQPIQGSHPGESGLSTLDYLLGDSPTVRPEMGIFLGSTRRMRPEICSTISRIVYEDRLHSHPNTGQRSLHLEPPLKHLNKDTGILFLPVPHEGNTQGSAEEAAVIGEVIEELLRGSLIENGKTRRLTIDDILVVAPYNLQVRLIQKQNPLVQVGSVDKFQGREAPVVILSMCTSDGASSSRGIEFVFSQSRLNVAISRAQCLAIVVGNPALVRTPCSSIKQMKLLNFFCHIVEEGTRQSRQSKPVPTQMLSSS